MKGHLCVCVRVCVWIRFSPLFLKGREEEAKGERSADLGKGGGGCSR